MKKNKWYKVLALALSLPSTILFMGWGTWKVVEMGLIEKKLAFIIFLLVICNSLILMVVYAVKIKNKS